MSDEARMFAEEWGGVWSEHHKHLVSHWRQEVESENTRASYLDGVLGRRDAENT